MSKLVRVAFSISGQRHATGLAFEPITVFLDSYRLNANTGDWWSDDCWINMLPGKVSGFGTVKRRNHTLYFYSNPANAGNPTKADFVLDYAPAQPRDYLDKQDAEGPGKIISPKNPLWTGASLNWKRIEAQPNYTPSLSAGDEEMFTPTMDDPILDRAYGHENAM